MATCQLVSVFICIVSLELVGTVPHTLLLLLTLAIAGILYINIVFFVYMRSIRASYESEQQRLLAEQQLQTQLAYYEQMKDSNEQTRRLWHDINKQLTAVTALMQESDATQAKQCLQQISDSFRAAQIIDVEHPVLNAILNDALGKARLAGVELKLDVFVSPQLALSPLALSVILGNTLDNAIRACSTVPTDVYRTVTLTLRQKDRILYYRIANPYDPSLTEPKRDGIHGYGLKNVTEAVEKCDGILTITQENGIYTVEAIINL